MAEENMQRRTQGKTAIQKRRQDAARLYLRGCTQLQIAEALKCDQATISRDLSMLRQEWRASAGADTAELRSRQAAVLDECEREAWVSWSSEHAPRYLEVIVKIADRRARLLGLNVEIDPASNRVPAILIDWDALCGAKSATVKNSVFDDPIEARIMAVESQAPNPNHNGESS